MWIRITGTRLQMMSFFIDTNPFMHTAWSFSLALYHVRLLMPHSWSDCMLPG